MFESSLEKKIRRFVEAASKLGLRPEDRDNALHFLLHNESGECFDTVVAQLYEYEIPIDVEFFKLAREIQDDLGIDGSEYLFLEKLLIRSECQGDATR